MTYIDTTLTPEAGYTHVNLRQIYDLIATQLTAHPAWEFVKQTEYTVAARSYRVHVWKCKAAASGLPKDFYVYIRTTWATSSGVYPTMVSSTNDGVFFSLSEDFNATTNVASRCAPVMSNTNFVLQSDQTHPTTWTITAAIPTAAGSAVATTPIGPTQAATSLRVAVSVTNGLLFVRTNSSNYGVYVGAFDTYLSAADDPMPVVLAANNTAGTFLGSNMSHWASTTRHPKVSPGTQNTLFGHWYQSYHGTASSHDFGSGSLLSSANTASAGVLGDNTNLNGSMFLGGVVASPVPLSTSGPNGTNGATKGGLRGTLRHFLTGLTVNHSWGDTFVIDGKEYVSFNTGGGGLWDTTA